MSPFWALLHDCGHSAEHNMEMETATLRDGAVDSKLFPGLKVSKVSEIFVELPVARSVAIVEKGEILTLPSLNQFE